MELKSEKQLGFFERLYTGLIAAITSMDYSAHDYTFDRIASLTHENARLSKEIARLRAENPAQASQN